MNHPPTPLNIPELLTQIDVSPQRPGNYNPPIGVVGCGGITVEHLTAYRNAGLHVAALCDIHPERAEKRRAEFFPDARVYTDHRDLLRDDQIEVVDLATHPHDRVELIEHAIAAGKHILSQKPFVLDLDVGRRLVDAADQKQIVLAVNQNGRFAPHFHFLRRAVGLGVLGQTFSAHLRVHWDHTWTRGTPFEEIKHLILFDFGIHWFDIVRSLIPGQKVKRVYATTARAPHQNMKPALLAQVLIEFDAGQASLVFDGAVIGEPLDETYVAGTLGSAHSTGPDLLRQTVTVHSQGVRFEPQLPGRWFPDAFQGTMVELLHSIEQRRPTELSAADNLHSLELCFAALQSADTGQPVSL